MPRYDIFSQFFKNIITKNVKPFTFYTNKFEMSMKNNVKPKIKMISFIGLQKHILTSYLIKLQELFDKITRKFSLFPQFLFK